MYNTIQREAILKVLCESGKHLAADEIYQILIDKISQLSLATVYRNLKKLESHGLIKEVTTQSQQKKFESNLTLHFHTHCPYCGEITDIDYETFAEVDKLLTEKTKKIGCDSYNIEFFSTCRKCRMQIARRPTENWNPKKKK